ncbi:MAG TPA: XdhC family protein [Gemmatirosa sp.]
MSDQRRVVAALAEQAGRGDVVLASVVRVVGAAYRGVGARMLVRADGTTVGMVSAGCLEADLVAHAAHVRATGAPALVTYNNDAGEDVVWGLGLGCDGTVEVLLEPLAPTRAAALAALLDRALAGDAPAPLATVVRIPDVDSSGAAPAVGARVLVTPAGPRCDGDWGDGTTLARVLAALPDAPATLDIGGVQVAVERVAPPVRLVVCGSGPDAAPVVRLAAGLGWDVTVIAPHATSAGRGDRFPGARMAACADPDQLADAVPIAARTAAVVMSHDYARDRAYLGALLDAEAGYVGVMGPRRRTERMLADLASVGRTWPDARLASLFAPVGLDVGGDGPEAIALAIVAEVSAAASGRGGGHLRTRRAPIHADV